MGNYDDNYLYLRPKRSSGHWGFAVVDIIGLKATLCRWYKAYYRPFDWR